MSAVIPLLDIEKVLPFEKPVKLLVFFLVATLPLLFGAVHPIVQGLYTFLMLVGLGGWMLYAAPELSGNDVSWSWLAIPLILIGYVALQSLPLPLPVLEILSPARAARVEMVNVLTHSGRTTASLSENGIIGVLNAIFFLSLLIYYVSLTLLLRRNKNFLVGILYILASIGLIEGIYGLLQAMNPGTGVLWLANKTQAAQGTIIYKNQYAALLNMCWPLAVAGGLLFLEPGQGAEKRNRNKNLLQRVAHSFSLVKMQVPFFFFAAGIMILGVIFSLKAAVDLVRTFCDEKQTAYKQHKVFARKSVSKNGEQWFGQTDDPNPFGS